MFGGKKGIHEYLRGPLAVFNTQQCCLKVANTVSMKIWFIVDRVRHHRNLLRDSAVCHQYTQNIIISATQQELTNSKAMSNT